MITVKLHVVSTVLVKIAFSIQGGPLDAWVTNIYFRTSLLSLFSLFLSSLLDRLSLSSFLSRAIIVAICQSNQPLHAPPRTEVDRDRRQLPALHTLSSLAAPAGKTPGIHMVVELQRSSKDGSMAWAMCKMILKSDSLGKDVFYSENDIHTMKPSNLTTL